MRENVEVRIQKFLCIFCVMEKDLEKQPFIYNATATRLVEGNKFRIKRHHVSSWMFAGDLYHTLLSLHAVWIFASLVLMYVELLRVSTSIQILRARNMFCCALLFGDFFIGVRR